MTPALPEAITLLVMATFLLAGTVKGLIGLGLPTVSLAILTLATDLPTAMVLLLVPSFATNLWQASMGGNAALLCRRLWPFLLPAALSVWIGALALQRIDLALLSALLGTLLVVYAIVSLAGLRLQFGEAQQHYETLLNQYPDQPQLLNNLAWVYYQVKDPRAVDTARRANELMPDNPNVLDTLGWIVANSGQPEQAVDPLRQAYQLSGGNPEIGYHLAFALAEAGQTAEARELIDALLAEGVSPTRIRAQVEALQATLTRR